MDISPFIIKYKYNDLWEYVEVRPCCKEDNVVDYAIWRKGKLEFTITKSKTVSEGPQGIIALKNADNLIANELINIIGAEIDNIKNS